jgi:hypothetical protein
MEPDRQTPTRRIRVIDWLRATQIADKSPGQDFLVGIADQSVRTHLRQGRYEYIDPDKYDCWTEAIEGSRTQARIFIRRRP